MSGFCAVRWPWFLCGSLLARGVGRTKSGFDDGWPRSIVVAGIIVGSVPAKVGPRNPLVSKPKRLFPGCPCLVMVWCCGLEGR